MSSVIHPTAEVSPDAEIGHDTVIWHHAQVRELANIGTHCVIGKGVYIDTGVVIGNNVKIQNYVSVYRGVIIEDGVLVGPHVCFTNDMFPRAIKPDGTLKGANDWVVIETRVRRGASIGANSTIRCGVTIGEWAMVGAGSVVTRDVPPYGLVYGNPARLRGFVCPCGAKLQEAERRPEYVVAQCSQCGRQIIIPLSDWEAIE